MTKHASSPEQSKGVAESAVDAVESAAHQGLLFTEGLLTGIVLNPLNGVEQLIDRTHSHLPKLALSNQQEVDKSVAGTMGRMVGSVLDFTALTVATGGATAALGATGVGAEFGALAAAGAVQGSVFTPSTDKHSGSFSDLMKDRLESCAVGAVAAPLGGMVGKVSSAFGEEFSNAGAQCMARLGFTALGANRIGDYTAKADVWLRGEEALSPDKRDQGIILSLAAGLLTGRGSK